VGINLNRAEHEKTKESVSLIYLLKRNSVSRYMQEGRAGGGRRGSSQEGGESKTGPAARPLHHRAVKGLFYEGGRGG